MKKSTSRCCKAMFFFCTCFLHFNKLHLFGFITLLFLTDNLWSLRDTHILQLRHFSLIKGLPHLNFPCVLSWSADLIRTPSGVLQISRPTRLFQRWQNILLWKGPLICGQVLDIPPAIRSFSGSNPTRTTGLRRPNLHPRHWEKQDCITLVSEPTKTLPTLLFYTQKNKETLIITGSGDKTVRFHCSGGLQDWLPSDESMQEHATLYPYCVFIRYIKGSTYIQECRNLRRTSQTNTEQCSLL
jgi:hypothetical protein